MSTEKIKIECAENCGNSPKKQLLRDFTIALVKNDFTFCLEWVRDDLIWEIVGEQVIEGKEIYMKQLFETNNDDVQHLNIHNIITHGNSASVNGTIIRKNIIHHFCDVYNFGGFGKTAKIKRITSYRIISNH